MFSRSVTTFLMKIMKMGQIVLIKERMDIGLRRKKAQDKVAVLLKRLRTNRTK